MGKMCLLMLALITCVGGEGGALAIMGDFKGKVGGSTQSSQGSIPKISLSERSDLRGKPRKIAVVT
jgi:hypothetical protein